MKIVITGSLGRISKPLTEELVQEGHAVIVISSNAARQKEIEAIGAVAAIGHMEDAAFLASTFSGADAVYCMEPPVDFFDPRIDINAFYQGIAGNYAQAISRSGVKRVVHLSSIGAHTNKGNGMLAFHYHVEREMEQIPGDVSMTLLRPVGFYYNLFAFIPMIKAANIMASNYNAAYKEPWVSPLDIADVAAAALTDPQPPLREMRYIASDEVTSAELAAILGKAVGKPELQWKEISDAELEQAYHKAGMSPQAIKGLVEMNASRRDAVLYEDYFRHQPQMLGNIKLADFAKEFAAVYNRQ